VIALAWLLSLAGAVVAFIISLAGAMKTVPSLHLGDALIGVPLPVVAATLAGLRLFGPLRPAGSGKGRPLISAGIPLVIAALTMLLLAVSYLDQPGGPQ
jgi:hypothetical protein